MDFDTVQKNFYTSTGFLKFKFLFFNKKVFNIKIQEIEKKINFSGYDKRLFSIDKKSSKAVNI
jgi:hypothetical protein